MKTVVTLVMSVSITMAVGCHSHKSDHELWSKQRDEAIAGVGFVKNPHTYDCKDDFGHGVKGHLNSGGRCDFTWDISDTTMDSPGHDEVGLLVPLGDTVRFKHANKNFTYSVRPNPNDLEKPPANTSQEQGCGFSPLPNPPSVSTNVYVLGAVHQSGTGTECHYKLTFTFFDGTAAIDPHIVIGGH